MALLSASEKLRLIARFMRENFDSSPYSKAQLSAACDAVDQWAEDNATSFNNALPVAFRTSATAAQKSVLLAYVLMRRCGRLPAEEDG